MIPGLAITLNIRRGALPAQDQYAQHEPLYKRSVEIQEKAFDPDDPQLVPTWITLRTSATPRGRYEQAESLYKAR